MTWTYADYRLIDGVPLPFHITIDYLRPHVAVKIAVDKYEVNPPLRDDQFQPPPGQSSSLEPPYKTAGLPFCLLPFAFCLLPSPVRASGGGLKPAATRRRAGARMTAQRWSALIERHTRAILIGSLALCVAAGLSLTRLRLDIDVLGMLPRGKPAFDDFKAFVADFGQLDELFILVDGRAARRAAAVADALTTRLRALDTITGVHGRIDTAAARSTPCSAPFLFNYIPVDDYAAGARTADAGGDRARSAPIAPSSRAVRRQPGARRHRRSARLPPHRRPQPRRAPPATRCPISTAATSPPTTARRCC